MRKFIKKMFIWSEEDIDNLVEKKGEKKARRIIKATIFMNWLIALALFVGATSAIVGFASTPGAEGGVVPLAALYGIAALYLFIGYDGFKAYRRRSWNA